MTQHRGYSQASPLQCTVSSGNLETSDLHRAVQAGRRRAAAARRPVVVGCRSWSADNLQKVAADSLFERWTLVKSVS